MWGYERMKSRANLIRLKQFQVNEKRRQLEQIDQMMSELQRMVNELENQIASEEKRAGITDVTHFAYPTFAKAARNRANNLLGSIRELQIQRDAAVRALEEAEAEYGKVTALEQRDTPSRSERTAL